MLIRTDTGASGRKRTALRQKNTVGWLEKIALPDWGIDGLEAKVDTGALTSALHVEELTLFKSGKVRFRVVLDCDAPDGGVLVRSPVLKWARVRSSNGDYTRRCFVRTRMVMGPVTKLIDLSLVSREKMLYRMLLGRKALKHDFIVDVSRRYILG